MRPRLRHGEGGYRRVGTEKHKQQAAQGSHVLVPIVRASRLAALIRDDPAGAAAAPISTRRAVWVDPRTFRRLVPCGCVRRARRRRRLRRPAPVGDRRRPRRRGGRTPGLGDARFTAFAVRHTLCFRSATATRTWPRPHRPDPQVVGPERHPSIAAAWPAARYRRRRERRAPRPHPVPGCRRRQCPTPGCTRRHRRAGAAGRSG
jgi:hypothetical protein